MIKNKYIFRLFIALVFILFFVNVFQIICNRRLIDGLEQLCGINMSYASYINKSFQVFVFIFETTTEEAFTQILFDLFEIP